MIALQSLTSILLQAPTDFLFKSEKIFTVLTVILIIWAGILVYLFFMGRKISGMEKSINASRKHQNKSANDLEEIAK